MLNIINQSGGQVTIINPPYHSQPRAWRKGWAKKLRIGRLYFYISNCRMKKRPIRDRGDFPDRDDDHIFNHLSRMVCSCRWIASPLTTIEKELEDARLGWTTEKVCIKVDPLEILQKGRIYCMEKFNGKYIVKDSDISMDEKTLNEYFADPDK